MKYAYKSPEEYSRLSSPARGTWIEIVRVSRAGIGQGVVPRTGDVD